MILEKFDKQAFYPGLQVEVKFAYTSRVFQIAQVDFEDRLVIDKKGNRYLREDIIQFIPPVDYNPCISCGAIHHPMQNTLCKR